MKIKLLVAAAATVMASSAMAQSAFEGFYGQIGAGYENNKVSGSNPILDGVFQTASPAVNDGTGQINLGIGYNASITKEFLLGVGVEYSTISSTLNAPSITFEGVSIDLNQKFKVSNRYSIFLTPGYVIDKDKLAYLKAGYSNQKIQSNVNQTAFVDADQGASIGSQNVGGYVVGLGYKQMITGGFYGFGEANYYNYSSASLNATVPSGATIGNNSVKPTAYNFLVGVGYKF